MSAVDPDPALQIAALEAAGVERLYTDRLPGNAAERPGLERALDALRPGDTLVCWRLDRLGRSVVHLPQLADDLRQRDVELRSLTEGIDTRAPAGEAYFTIMAVMTQMERRLNSGRTKAGIAARWCPIRPSRQARAGRAPDGHRRRCRCVRGPASRTPHYER